MSIGFPSQTSLESLLGLRLFTASHAADMREFGFRSPGASDESQQAEWFLHIQCPWRIESQDEILTGNFDWFEPAEQSNDLGPEWDPATGGSLQERRLRDLFHDAEIINRTLKNRTNVLVLISISISAFGDLTIELTGELRLRILPSGSRGEFWRIFEKGNLDSHMVCELE